ncbi:hypothetical protein [Crateriforma conspicua]|uniref:hypothetical protein n=1 Tax=Crateriforma conspicua TaxID=2527996 RepID=UPI0013FD0C54|nr:hypothetical protein [Crateriforma conspicua]
MKTVDVNADADARDVEYGRVSKAGYRESVGAEPANFKIVRDLNLGSAQSDRLTAEGRVEFDDVRPG